ncbi:hypothetical protein CK203_036143 [Vitis vinifera]|uniref:Retrotransposon gag domain-containing protein n=1 Tax=Vitis vinifera TaxID=29760 RepID=A0A438IWS0_VITVI|nr:hypothetical protein CK203_036143 [Vitis vinifera]
MGVGRSFIPKWQGWNSHDFQEMIQPNGSTMWNNSLNTRAQQNTKRFPWLLITLKGRPTSGGSCEDFDEALSRIKQLGTLRDYQREFEKLGNRVRGWTQKALVRTFMGGLKAEISDGIQMFKPNSLKETINLTRMRNEQLARQWQFIRPPPMRAPLALPQPTCVAPATPVALVKHLSWEEMQRKRA